jgi:hypothetical protein
MYERPQMIAFLISLLPQEERTEALRSLPRERAMVEELLNTLKSGPLRPKLEAKLKEVFAGKIF